MIKITSTEKTLGILAGAFGIVEAIAWTILCIITLAVAPWPGYKENDSFPVYMNTVAGSIFTSYLYDGPTPTVFEDGVTGRVGFLVLVYFYLVLDLLWLGISSFLVFACGFNKIKLNWIKLGFISWASITSIISVLDFVFTILVGVDYNKCLANISRQPYPREALVTIQMVCTNGTLPVLVVAAKGFILWIINVTLICLMVKLLVDAKSANNDRSNEADIERPNLPTFPSFTSRTNLSTNNSTEAVNKYVSRLTPLQLPIPRPRLSLPPSSPHSRLSTPASLP